MSKTEHRIAYKAGITRSPSDFLCEDGELAECINLTTDNEELKVVSLPEKFITQAVSSMGAKPINIRLLYVHKLNSEERYIAVNTAHNYLVWGKKEGTIFFEKFSFNAEGKTLVYTENTKITSIGKTLIISDNDSTYYYLWENNDYKYLGDRIPEPKIEFKMQTSSRMPHNVMNDLENEFLTTHESGLVTINDGKQEDYNNLVIGLYEKNLKEIKDDKGFTEPFSIRYALEMYDGSYSMQSAPIMLFPSISRNTYGNIMGNKCRLITYYTRLLFNASFDYYDWEDLIKDVVVFASDGINIYDTSVDQSPRTLNSSMFCYDFIAAGAKDELSKYGTASIRNSHEASGGNYVFLPLKEKGNEEVFHDMEEISVFYKIFSLGMKGNGDWEEASKYIRAHTLKNLTTQDQLPDDYYSHTIKIGKNIFSYNYRLLLSNVMRGFYDGESTFLPYDNDNSYDYHIYVYIRTQGDDRIVMKDLSTYEKIGNYFFYPDPRAYKAEVFFADGSHVATLELKEHQFLNGAYCFDHLPVGPEGEPTADNTGMKEPKENKTPEILNNQVWVSEVNNPFVFKAEGNITIGNGNILGISSLTQALSQGQFGQYPLIIFTDEGIWAASTGTTGLFTAVHPMSREVCNNPKSIIQTDGSVFFTSKKGLMVIAGSTVKCVTERMNGVAFDTSGIGANTDWSDIISQCANGDSFLQYIRDENCFMAYDYIDSRLLIVNPSYEFSYLYSMTDGNVSKVIMPGKIMRSVNYYPDYLIQDENGIVYSLYSKKDETEVGERQLGFLLTRPMKLTGPLNVSSLRELVNVGYWNKKADSSVKTEVFVSDNLVDWYDMESRFGASAKYFRIALYINLYPTERLSGTIIRSQERRSDNAR